MRDEERNNERAERKEAEQNKQTKRPIYVKSRRF